MAGPLWLQHPGCHHPSAYARKDTPIYYQYLPVLGEGLADPVVTGREELGFRKLSATVPEPMFLRDSVRGAARREGFCFCEFAIDGLLPHGSPPNSPHPFITRKFAPRTGDWGLADIDQLTGPASDPDGGLASRPTVLRREQSAGRFRFIPARWGDMPTQYPVVCRLAELPIHSFTSATIIDIGRAAGNGRGQAVYEDLVVRLSQR